MNMKRLWKSLYKLSRNKLRASAFDAAVTNHHNSDHWKNTTYATGDSVLIGDDSLNIIRARVRSEMRNNSYMLGIVRKLADYVVSTGPSVQVLSDDKTWNQIVELKFNEWANDPEQFDVVGNQSYADMLHMGISELYPAGEYIRQIVIDKDVPNGIVPMKNIMISPERLSTPGDLDNNIIAGVEKNKIGKPEKYWISKTPTGIQNNYYSADEYQQIPASKIIHFFVSDRPEMTRGTPLGAAILNIFATLRRFDEATIRAAEMAALFAAFMTTDAPDGYDPDVDPEQFDIEAGTFMTLPPGSKIQQVTPQHPSAVYEAFKKSKLMDAGASTSMPYNVLASDSSGHNYASGRLDWQGLVRAVRVHRQRLIRRDCNKTFAHWYNMAKTVYGWTGKKIPKVKFMFPGFEHVDPGKEAKAAVLKIQNNLQTYADYYAEQGKDWRDQFLQMKIEEEALVEFGLTADDVTDNIDDQAKSETERIEEIVSELAEIQGVDVDEIEVEL